MRVRIFRILSLSLLFVITFSVTLVTTGLAQSPDDTPVTFPDANLEAAIREVIDKPRGLIFTSDLDGLTSLKASWKIGEIGEEITDLTGLEYCINLTKLDLAWNQITDISPLASLPNLTELDLSGNQISDISPLASLTNLTDLRLGGNKISDISPLTSLTNLTKLYLSENQITDISPLANLTNLTKLYLGSNQISDLSPLTNLINLTDLGLEWNQIADASPLLENGGLGKRDRLLLLRGNPLSDTSLNVYIPQLRSRGVSIPKEKTYIGIGRGEFLLIPLVAFIIALVIVLLVRPNPGLVIGVILTGLYTGWFTLAMTFDVVYLEDLLFWVWIPGLVLYGIIALLTVITRKKG